MRGGLWMAGLLACLFVAMPVHAQESPLPANTIIHIRIGPVGRLLGSGDGQEGVDGSQTGHPTVSARLTEQISRRITLHMMELFSEEIDVPVSILPIVDPTRSIHYLVLDDGEDDIVVLLLPLELDGASRAAIALLDEPGVEWIEGDEEEAEQGGKYFYSPIGGGYTVFTPSWAGIHPEAVAVMKGWNPPAPIEDSDIEMTLVIDHMYDLHGTEILESLLSFGRYGTDEVAMIALMDATFEGIFDVIEQTKSLRFWGNYSSGEISLTCEVSARPGSALAAFLNLRTADPLPLDLLGRLPSDTLFLSADGSHEELYARFADHFGNYVVDALAAFHEEGAIRLRDAIGKSLHAHGPSASSIHAVPEGDPDTGEGASRAYASITYIRARDPEGLIDARLEMAEATNLILEAIIKHDTEDPEDPEAPSPGSPLRITGEKKAAWVGEIPLSRIRWSVEGVDESTGDEEQDEEAEIIKEYLTALSNRMTGMLAVHDGVVITVRGTDDPHMMERAIRALIEGDADPAAQASRIAEFTPRDHHVTNVLALDAMPLVKWWFRNEIESLPDPENTGSLPTLLDAIPSTSPPILLEGRLRRDGMRLDIRVPPQTVLNLGLHGTAFLSTLEKVEREQWEVERKQRREQARLEKVEPRGKASEEGMGLRELDASSSSGHFFLDNPIPYDHPNHAKFEEGIRLVQTDNFVQARSLFQEIIDDHPTNAETWRWLGDCNYNLMELGKALEAYQEAQRLNPKNYFARRGEGLARLHNGHKIWITGKQLEGHAEYLRSIAILRQCVLEYPADMDAVYGRAMAAEGTSRLLYMNALLLLSRGELQLAEAELRSGLDVILEGIEAAEVVIHSMADSGNEAASVGPLDINGGLHQRHAMLLHTFKRENEAIQSMHLAVERYRMILRIDPTNLKAEEELNRCLTKLEEWTRP